MATVDATDYSQVPWDLRVNGSEGRAVIGGQDVRLEYWNGKMEHWTNAKHDGSGMDVALREIVKCLGINAPGMTIKAALRTLGCWLTFGYL